MHGAIMFQVFHGIVEWHDELGTAVRGTRGCTEGGYRDVAVDGVGLSQCLTDYAPLRLSGTAPSYLQHL